MKFLKALAAELAAAIVFGVIVAGIVYVGITTSPLYG
jgi:hypothetical protein